MIMPRPPILPVIDWKDILAKGKEYRAWLEGAEKPEHAEKMEAIRRKLKFEHHEEAWLAALNRPVWVAAFAEDWCGDVVRHAPVLQGISDRSPNVHVRYLKREDALDVFVRFLTNGGESVPKFVFLSDQYMECGNWGPMGSVGRELIARGKACGDIGAARKKVGMLYEADHNYREIIRELMDLVEIASCSAP
jgi:hypothetical protein